MIHLNCPNCGRRGIVPDTKIYTRLHCSKCDVVFHVEHDGRVVLGEPGSARKAKLGDPDKPLAPTAEPESVQPSDLLDRMPAPILFGLLAFIALALIWAFRGMLWPGTGS